MTFYRYVYLTRKWILNAIKIIVLAVMVLFVGGWLLINMPVLRSYVIAKFVNVYQSEFPSKLSIKKVSGIVPFGLSFEDVSVINTDTLGKSDTVLTLQKVYINLDIWSLWRSRLKVQSFDLIQPKIYYRELPDGNNTFSVAFSPQKIDPEKDSLSAADFLELQIYAPRITVQKGEIDWQLQEEKRSEQFHFTKTGRISGITADLFLEATQNQILIDLFDARAESEQIPSIQEMKAQLFVSDELFELNGLSLKTRESSFSGMLSMKRKQTDTKSISELFANPVKAQFSDIKLNPGEWKGLFPIVQTLNYPLKSSISFSGNSEFMQISEFNLSYGTNHIKANGTLENWLDVDKISFSATMEPLILSVTEAQKWLPVSDSVLKRLDHELVMKGTLSGKAQFAKMDLNIASDAGMMDLKGSIDSWADAEKFNYDLEVFFNQFDVQPWFAQHILKPLQGRVQIKGTGRNPDEAVAQADLALSKIQMNDFVADSLHSRLSYNKKQWLWDAEIKKGISDISMHGTWADKGNRPSYSLRSDFKFLNLSDWLLFENTPETQLNGRLNVEGSGINPDDVSGQISVDIIRALVNSESLPAHQFYADLNSPEQEQRHLRVTSSFFDLDMSGTFAVTKWKEVFDFWQNGVQQQFRSLYLIQENDSLANEPYEPVIEKKHRLDVDFKAKNLSVLNTYYHEIPKIHTSADAKLRFEIGEGSVVLTGQIQAPEFKAEQFELKNGGLEITLSSNNLSELKDNLVFVVKTAADEIRYGDNKIKKSNLSVEQDGRQVLVRLNSENDKETIELNLDFAAFLRDSLIQFDLKKLFVGNRKYMWSGESKGITLDKKLRVKFEDFTLKNRGQTVFISGALSESESDSMIYKIENLNLGQINDLWALSYDLNGIINGQFETKTLTSIPQFQGKMVIDEIQMGGRSVGTAQLNSVYNPKAQRFDASASIVLDSVTYPEYWKTYKRGNNIFINGYLNRPDERFHRADTLYYFDIDLAKTDLWMLNYFIPQIFSKIEGNAVGKGFITGGLGWFDYYSRFDLQNVKTVPYFLNADFYMTGPVIFGYHEGVVFDNLQLKDGKGGTGSVKGVIDLDYFGDNRSYQLQADLRNFEFLNNSFTTDVPFYGKVAGTGSIRLTGSTQHPFLETVGPVATLPGARLSVPLIDKGKVESQSRFIEFVESFDEHIATTDSVLKSESIDSPITNKNQKNTEVKSEESSFTEMFQMNLQFKAPDETRFELVFDPITGEVLTAYGGGTLNLFLENQELKMYGSFEAESGEYLFVGGDVFTRKFIINKGGTISWDGEPQNPRINLKAEYRSRPNMLPITGMDMRMPINLILNLTGTIESLQNDFYFEIPNTTFQDVNSTSALRLLNSEEQKLPQATSLLLTGNFFATNAVGAENSFGNNLQSNATEAGLSQLLSNQINNILNSSMSNLDIDLNLTGFDQADLGIALRLFNDRLVLRREGQLINNQPGATNQNMIGDLGASYKISNALSVELFYRQDPTLGGFSAIQDQAQNVSGVGLQYQIQFNRWSELPGKIWNNIKEFFGFKPKESPDGEVAEAL